MHKTIPLGKRKQWVKIWGMYKNRSAVEACTQVKEANNNKGHKAESNAIRNITFHYKNT